MARFILRRLSVMLLTGFCLTVFVFVLTNLQPSLEKLAKTEVNTRMTDEEVMRWLTRHGYEEPMLKRYGEWLGVAPGWTGTDEAGKPIGRCIIGDVPPESAPSFCGILEGYFGYSTVFRAPVSAIDRARPSSPPERATWPSNSRPAVTRNNHPIAPVAGQAPRPARASAATVAGAAGVRPLR